MSNLDDIFDLPEGAKQYVEEVKEQPEKKQRKKPELSEEKKVAMLERLKAGREKRQENLKAKKEIKEEPKEVIKKEKEVIKKTDTEAERMSFINMMAGKSKPVEKYERPKKKVQSLPKEEIKDEKKKEEPKKEPEAPIIIPTNIAIPTKAPVIIRTFKKPIWAQ